MEIRTVRETGSTKREMLLAQIIQGLPWRASLEAVTAHGRHIVLEATDNTLRLVASQGFLEMEPVFALTHRRE